MADTSHHDSSDVLHYHATGEQSKRRSAPVALTVIAVLLALSAAALTYKLKQQSTTIADARAQMVQANSNTDVAKAELTAANAKSVNLQAQLEKANRGQADLQAQMKKTEELGVNLQAQLDKAQADLKSQQATAQTQSSEFQSQLGLANDSAAGLRKELATAKSQIDDLKGQIAKAQAEVTAPAQAVAAPPKILPLTAEFKKSFFGGNYSLQVKNTGADPLTLDIGITGSDKTPSRSETIQAGGTLKIDGMVAGASVVIKSDGFQPVTLTAKAP